MNESLTINWDIVEPVDGEDAAKWKLWSILEDIIGRVLGRHDGKFEIEHDCIIDYDASIEEPDYQTTVYFEDGIPDEHMDYILYHINLKLSQNTHLIKLRL